MKAQGTSVTCGGKVIWSSKNCYWRANHHQCANLEAKSPAHTQQCLQSGSFTLHQRLNALSWEVLKDYKSVSLLLWMKWGLITWFFSVQIKTTKSRSTLSKQMCSFLEKKTLKKLSMQSVIKSVMLQQNQKIYKCGTVFWLNFNWPKINSTDMKINNLSHLQVNIYIFKIWW